MKALKYLYVILWAIGIPTIIGTSLGEMLLRMYHNLYNDHLLAGVGVCLISGAVVAWIPMGIHISTMEEIHSPGNRDFRFWTVGFWIAGCVAPIIFGFQELDKILVVLLLSSAAITTAKLSEGIRELENYREKEFIKSGSPGSVGKSGPR